MWRCERLEEFLQLLSCFLAFKLCKDVAELVRGKRHIFDYQIKEKAANTFSRWQIFFLLLHLCLKFFFLGLKSGGKHDRLVLLEVIIQIESLEIYLSRHLFI